MPTTYIANTDHYNLVLSRVASVRKSLWIGTADIKDLYVKVGAGTKPFLAVLAQLVRKGVEPRIRHQLERPYGRDSSQSREDFDQYPSLIEGMERALCPRVHFKLLVFDCQEVYIGSANLTGAGIGMKGENTRNFEAGILTDDPALVSQAIQQFDSVWMGLHCKTCKRRQFCTDPIA